MRGANHPVNLFSLILVLLLVLFGCQNDKITYPQRQMPEGFSEDLAMLQAGHHLFLDKCASCHGKPSEGRSERAAFFEPPAPDFTDAHYQEVDPAYLYWRIEVGKDVEPYRTEGSVMPAWGLHFSDEEIWQVVAYLQARAH